MITYRNLKTGNRYPERGVASSFSVFSDKPGRLQHHIKPGYPECTNGWKMVRARDWTKEEIPDLPKPFTDEQWREYAGEYGSICAQEFFDCCDYSKPRMADELLRPPKGKWDEATDRWFKGVFGQSIFCFTDHLFLSLANTYAIDIVKFEKYLDRAFGYPSNKDGSMHDFMVAKFGKAITYKFMEIAFKNGATELTQATDK